MQAEGRGFKSHRLHQEKDEMKYLFWLFCAIVGVLGILPLWGVSALLQWEVAMKDLLPSYIFALAFFGLVYHILYDLVMTEEKCPYCDSALSKGNLWIIKRKRQ